MKKKEKILIAVLVAITLVVIIFAANRNKNQSAPVASTVTPTENGDIENLEEPVVEKYVEVGDDGSKVNTSEALKSNKVVNNIEFSDIQLSQRNGETLLTANIKNTGSTPNELFSVSITLVDDAGQDIVNVGGLVAPLEAGATGQFETSMALDFANAYDFRVELDEQ